MKKCPFCAEEIQDAAIKCRHCGSMLTGGSALGVATLTPVDADVQRLLSTNKKIEAIKLVRDAKGMGLAEAKAYVEAFADTLHAPDQTRNKIDARASAVGGKSKFGRRMAILLVGGIFFALALPQIIETLAGGGSPSAPASRTTATTPRDDFELFVMRFGQPDTDESSENETPRPPIVTRILTYRSERVRVAYRANVQFGSPPPYDGKWKLFGFLDPQTDGVISPTTATQRLANRDRQKR